MDLESSLIRERGTNFLGEEKLGKADELSI
jgi:hypothetical protein